MPSLFLFGILTFDNLDLQYRLYLLKDLIAMLRELNEATHGRREINVGLVLLWSQFVAGLLGEYLVVINDFHKKL